MPESTRSIEYGLHPRQKLDLHIPEIKAETGRKQPILFLYGGGWKRGSRRMYSSIGRALAKEGFLTAIADYRLFPEVRFPSFNQDAALAVKWLAENAENHGALSGGISVIGHSAGAHIGALLFLDPQYLAEVDLTPDIISSYVGLSGPYTMNLAQYDSVSTIFATAEHPDHARPIKWVSDSGPLPKSLLLHGRADRTVYLQNTQYFANALEERGAKVETVSFHRVGHVDMVLALSPYFRWRAPVWDRVISFLNSDDITEAADEPTAQSTRAITNSGEDPHGIHK